MEHMHASVQPKDMKPHPTSPSAALLVPQLDVQNRPVNTPAELTAVHALGHASTCSLLYQIPGQRVQPSDETVLLHA